MCWRRLLTTIGLMSIAQHSLAAPTCDRASTPTANIQNGSLVGAHNEQYNQDFFLGIPYAQPPVDDLCFKPPQPINHTWQDKQVTAYGDWCMQAELGLPGFSFANYTPPQSEDCLTLNVVRPTGVNNYSSLPVFLWIHGGALSSGSAIDQRYNMSFIVEESVAMGLPIIGVSINYRLNGFGFLAGSEVLQEGVANLGYRDQRLALQWVQENIASFGGDPEKVTIAGESSGANSVGQHFTAYGGRDDGLFRAGVAESGGPLSAEVLLPIDVQDQTYRQVLRSTNCTNANDTLECLRRLPVDVLTAAFRNGGSYLPVIDGDFIMDYAYNQIEQGRFVKRPLLIGNNRNEGTSFIVQSGVEGADSTGDILSIVRSFDQGAPGVSNDTLDVVSEAYATSLTDQQVLDGLGTVSPDPGVGYGPFFGRAAIYVGDFFFNAARRFTCERWFEEGAPAYSYHFYAVPNGVNETIFGATHFQEVAFVFRNYLGVGYENVLNTTGLPLVSNDAMMQREYHDLSSLMSRMWVSFVSTLTPNDNRVVGFDTVWPSYSNATPVNMAFHLNESTLEQDDFRPQAIDLITSFYDVFRYKRA
ncbi:hypothetical protein D0862_03583 [Hortaea werneckii]|uniref:Carboxylic ester hydrolase n=1 Tax=Hortaea werneckii TaxID=91943 RepID=A0A3M7H8E7_HORWE|nr:hypothetical protein D0862_03583 [Hortaea werneckii]